VKRNGFTLVEVMIALMIFGMIAAAGVALLSFSVRAQAATAAKLDDIAAISRLSSLLSADLAQAVDRPVRDEGGVRLPAFVGESGGASLLRFTRAGWSNVDAAPRASLQRVEYRVAGDVLERIAWPMLDGVAPLPAAAVLAGVTQTRLRYRIAGAWSDRWDGTQGAPLPQAIEVAVTRADGTPFRMLFVVGTGAPPKPPTPPAGAPDAP